MALLNSRSLCLFTVYTSLATRPQSGIWATEGHRVLHRLPHSYQDHRHSGDIYLHRNPTINTFIALLTEMNLRQIGSVYTFKYLHIYNGYPYPVAVVSCSELGIFCLPASTVCFCYLPDSTPNFTMLCSASLSLTKPVRAGYQCICQ